MKKTAENPNFERRATSRDINGLITRVGEIFGGALVRAGHIQVGQELPDVVEAPLHVPTLKKTHHFNMWDKGVIQYSPAMLGKFGETEDPASVTVSFAAALDNLPGSQRETSIYLVPSFVNLIDEEEAAQTYRGGGEFPTICSLPPEEIVRAAASLTAQTPSEILEQDEVREAVERAMGFDPASITLGEVSEFRALATASIKPNMLQIP